MSYCSSVGQLLQLVLEPAVLYYLCVKYITYHDEDDFDDDDQDDKSWSNQFWNWLCYMFFYYFTFHDQVDQDDDEADDDEEEEEDDAEEDVDDKNAPIICVGCVIHTSVLYNFTFIIMMMKLKNSMIKNLIQMNQRGQDNQAKVWL